MSEVDLICDEGESALGGWSPEQISTHGHGETTTSTDCLNVPFPEAHRSHLFHNDLLACSDEDSLETEPPSSSSDFAMSPCDSIRQDVNHSDELGVDLNLTELLTLVNQRHTGEINENLMNLRQREACVLHKPSVSGTNSVRTFDRRAPLTWILKVRGARMKPYIPDRVATHKKDDKLNSFV